MLILIFVCFAYLKHNLSPFNITATNSQISINNSFDYIRIKNQRSHFILISSKKKLEQRGSLDKKKLDFFLTRKEIRQTFEILSECEAFILDVQVLEGLQVLNSSHCESFNKVKRLYKRLGNDEVFVNFGVAIDGFNRLYKVCYFFLFICRV